MSSDDKPSRLRRAWHVVAVSFRVGGRMGLATVWKLLVVMVPVIVAVMLLEGFDVLRHVAGVFRPVMRLLGLPGDAALVFLSGALVSIYSAVAVAANITVTVKQMTVLAVLCLVCHALPIECAVQKQAGTGVRAMTAVRLVMALLGALALYWLIPRGGAWADLARRAQTRITETPTFWEFLTPRLVKNGWLLLKIVVIVMAIMILMELLRRTGVLRVLTVLMRPVTWAAGIPADSGFTVLTSMTIGLAFGAGTVIAESKRGHLSHEEQFRTNVFIGTTHSLFEDTVYWAILGASVLWIVAARLIIGCVAVRLFSLARWGYLKLRP